MSAPTTGTARLPRVLGPWVALAVVVGTVIGSGVFKKPHAVAEALPYTGLAALVWVAGGLLALLGALAYAEVAVLYPRAGGNYVFLREGYGRLAGFLWGWVEFWIIRAGSLAALATIFTESLADVLVGSGALAQAPSFWSQRVLTVAVLLALTAVNAVGVRWGGGLQLVITIVKVGSLVAIFGLAMVFLCRSGPAPGGGTTSVEQLRPVWPESVLALSLTGVGSALLAVLWAYHGWMNIAPVAEEVSAPQRNIPLSLIGGVGAVIALYLSANLAYHLVLPQTEMAGLRDTTVVGAFGLKLLGNAGLVLASAAVMCSVFGALNGNLLVGPRLLYAMGEDRLAPRALGTVNPVTKTPVVAITVMGAWGVVLVLGMAVLTATGLLDPKKSHFDRMTDFAMFGAVIFETLAVMTLFVFRRRYPDAIRPYRCPGYPYLPAVYFVLPLFVLINMFWAQPVEAFVGLGFIAAGALLYLVLGLQGVSEEAKRERAHQKLERRRRKKARKAKG